MRARSIFLVAAGALAPASDVFADEPGIYGFGSRAEAMAGAVSADDTDFSANYYNPAGLAGENGIQIGFGYTHAANNLRINGQDSGVDNVHGFTFGLAAAGKVFGLFPVAFGVAAHLPDQGLSRVTALREGVPRWELYDSRAAVIYLTANVAIKPVEWLEVGGGVSFLAATKGKFNITGTANILSPFDSQLRHEVDADLTAVRYPEAGIRVHLGTAADLALVYRHETKLDLQLAAELKGNVDFAGILVPLEYSLSSHTIAAFLPAQLVIGTSLHLVKGLHVNADVTYLHWSGYDSPTAETAAKLRVTPPAGLMLDLPSDVKPTVPIPPRFEDRIVPRIGAEWYLPWFGDHSPIDLALRAGYVFEKSPVPPQTGVTNFVDTDRHTVTLGLGARLHQPKLSLDAHFAYSALPDRVTLKSNPADPVGDYDQSGSMLNAGVTLGARFP